MKTLYNLIDSRNIFNFSKKTSLLLGLVMTFFINSEASAQCGFTNITLTTQAEVDNFATDYPDCADIPGTLAIGPSSDVTNLDGLAGVNTIGNQLVINSNQALTDVSGLVDLQSIVVLSIKNNNVLSCFPGF